MDTPIEKNAEGIAATFSAPPPFANPLDNLTVVLGTAVHICFLSNFLKKLLEIPQCVEEMNKYTDLAFIINSSENDAEFIQVAGEEGVAFLKLSSETGIEVLYNKRGGYELGGWAFMRDRLLTDNHKFGLLLQCSTQIESEQFWSMVFNNDEELFLDWQGLCHMYKISSARIKEYDFHYDIQSKSASCGSEGKLANLLSKGWFNKGDCSLVCRYAFSELGKHVRDAEVKFSHSYGHALCGRLNLIHKTKYFTKFRGCWDSTSMLEAEKGRFG